MSFECFRGNTAGKSLCRCDGIHVDGRSKEERLAENTPEMVKAFLYRGLTEVHISWARVTLPVRSTASNTCSKFKSKWRKSMRNSGAVYRHKAHVVLLIQKQQCACHSGYTIWKGSRNDEWISGMQPMVGRHEAIDDHAGFDPSCRSGDELRGKECDETEGLGCAPRAFGWTARRARLAATLFATRADRRKKSECCVATLGCSELQKAWLTPLHGRTRNRRRGF